MTTFRFDVRAVKRFRDFMASFILDVVYDSLYWRMYDASQALVGNLKRKQFITLDTSETLAFSWKSEKFVGKNFNKKVSFDSSDIRNQCTNLFGKYLPKDR